MALHPGVFGKVQIPTAAIGHANGFALCFVRDLIESDAGREDIHKDMTRPDGYQTGARFRPADECKFHRVHSVNIPCNTSDAIFIALHNPNEMAMMVFFVLAAVDNVHFFALL